MDSSVLHTEDDLFYFETDQLALKGNKDYCEVLKTIVILTAQREKALKDLAKVVQIKKQSLEDPIGSLNKVRNGDDLDLPALPELPKLPNIDFQKYDVKVSEEDLREIYSNTPQEKRVESPKKPSTTLSKKWTTEEQKRLEELLMVYPPEPIEIRRFQKIAKALGNRTVQQVSSRVQKYFLKLYKAGLPIPGRIPKSGEKHKKSLMHKHQRHNHYLWKPTTFFPELCVPVTMNELDNDVPGPSTSAPSTSQSTNYLIPTTAYHQPDKEPKPQLTDRELQIELLMRIKQEKIRESEAGYNAHYHVGYRCDYCNETPVGTRWHCITCMDSVDFCCDCILAQLYSESKHPLNHRLVVYYNDENVGYSSDSESNSEGCNKNEEEEEEEGEEDSECEEAKTEPNGTEDVGDCDMEIMDEEF